MDPVVFTSRLKLVLVTKAERGSPEFEWLHELHSNEGATYWSINGQAKSIEDTEKVMRGYLPTTEGKGSTYRVAYAVRKILKPTSDSVQSDSQSAEYNEISTELIGLVTLKSLDASSLALPEDIMPAAAAATTTLDNEIAYMYLPAAWGKGYATESIEAIFESCRKKRSFWTPFTKLYVRAIVNEENPASQRVMEKTGMKRQGVYHWSGKATFLGGKWREQDNLHIFGMHLLK